MVKYGKIEDGVLRSREIEAYPERYQETENGVTEVKERTVTVAEQAAVLDSILKEMAGSTADYPGKC